MSQLVPELTATARGDREQGDGARFTPHPRLPSIATLDYVQKLATAGLLVLGFLLLVAYGIVNPAGAFSVIVRGAKRQAGVA